MQPPLIDNGLVEHSDSRQPAAGRIRPTLTVMHPDVGHERVVLVNRRVDLQVSVLRWDGDDVDNVLGRDETLVDVAGCSRDLLGGRGEVKDGWGGGGC